MSDIISEMDKEAEVSELPEQRKIEECTRSRPGGCRIKNASWPHFPALPRAPDIENNLANLEIATKVTDMKQ